MFPRIERMPGLQEFLGIPVEAEDGDEISTKLEHWSAVHNLRLGDAEKHYVVAELVEDD